MNKQRWIPIFCFLLFEVVLSTGANSHLNELPSRDGTQEVYAKVNNQAFTYGERLDYRMHYGPFNAGYATIEIGAEPVILNGRKTFYVHGAARSSKFIDRLLNKVRNDYESYIDVDALIPVKFTKKVEEGHYQDSDFALFDHENHRINAKKGNVLDVPNKAQDIVSAYYWARVWNVANARVGDSYPIDFYMDGKFYNYTIKYLGKEEITIDLGKFKAIKIRPQVKSGDLFKSEDALTLWVSDDDNHILLKAESEILIGSVALTLTDFHNLKNPFASKIQ